MAKCKPILLVGRNYDIAVLRDVELPLEREAAACPVRRVAHCLWHPGFHFFEPAFVPFFFGLVLRGRGVQWNAEGVETELVAGSVFACGAGGYRGHAVSSADGLEVLFFVTRTTGAGAGWPLASVLGPLPVAFPAARAGELEPIFRLMLAEGGRMGRESLRICARLAEVLVLQAAEALFEGPRKLSSGEELFLRARRYVREHLETPLGAGDLAVALGVSRAYLARVFAEFAGETPLAYIQRQRMARASELLRTRAHSVSEVAYALGFTDPPSFSRAFKRIVGISPSELLPDSGKR